MSVKVSVVIAAYRPGEAFQRVVHSLDDQSMPQSDFEVIVIDDGSGDDTYARVTQIAATRANWQVQTIPNSGWPSRPRNIGISVARGDYILFMDHDDSLYPTALERGHALAASCGADLLSPKESKTDDLWWGLDAGPRNVPDVAAAGGIKLIKPLVPHKMYRRSFLIEHGILFPEGRRKLWEDVYFNVAAYRRASVVTAQADTPFYLWHSSSVNNSKSYGPQDLEYWDRLDELYEFLATELAGAEQSDARRELIMTQYRNRTLRRVTQSLRHLSPAQRAEGLRRAQRQADRYLEEGWEAALAPLQRTQSRLVRQGHTDGLESLAAWESPLKATVQGTAPSWVDGVLHVDFEASIGKRGGSAFVERDGRIVRNLPETLVSLVESDFVDVTDRLSRIVLRAAVRSRAGFVTWTLPVKVGEAWFGDGALHRRATVTIDLRGVAGGHPLGPDVWDVHGAFSFDGARRGGRMLVEGMNTPALVDGLGFAVYRNKRNALSIDGVHELRSLVTDGKLTAEGFSVDGGLVHLPLTNMHVAGDSDLPARLLLRPRERSSGLRRFLSLWRPDQALPVPGTISGHEGRAHVTFEAPAAHGLYEVVDPTRKLGATGILVNVTRGGVDVIRA